MKVFKTMWRSVSFAVVILAAVSAAAGQSAKTANTLNLDAGKTGEKASISDLAWMAGAWSGPGLGGISEENWSKPAGGSIVGTFRLLKDGKPVFYEICWILETEGTLIFRLKHFNADLSAWEEKAETTDFRFVKRDGNRFYFSGLTLEKAGADGFTIYLALRQTDGKVSEETFKLKRQ